MKAITFCKDGLHFNQVKSQEITFEDAVNIICSKVLKHAFDKGSVSAVSIITLDTCKFIKENRNGIEVIQKFINYSIDYPASVDNIIAHHGNFLLNLEGLRKVFKLIIQDVNKR